MRAWFNMPTHEFVSQLRDIAIKTGARPAVIDCIDAIQDAPGEEEVEERMEAAHEEGISEGRDNQWEICFDAVEKLRRRDPNKIGLTEEQLEQVLAILTRLDPR